MRIPAHAILLTALATSLSACTPVPDTGEEGKKCFDNGTCLPGLMCAAGNVCVKPAGGAGGDVATDVGEARSDGGDEIADVASPPDAGDASGDDATGNPDAGDSGSDADLDDVSTPPDASDAGFDAEDDVGGDADDTGVPDTGGDAGCVPNCGGKQCGENGCGGSCGSCNNAPSSICLDSTNIREYSPTGTCNSGTCDYQPTDRPCPNGCASNKCQNCTPDCAGKDCGLDGCGGTCGNCTTCKNICDVNTCKAASHASATCDSGDLYWFDSCGTKEDLKTDCTGGQTCFNNACCTPSCSGKCGGSDSCGGICPDNCVLPQTCGGGGTQNVCGCIPSCTDKCGGNSDGCGGTCSDPCNGHGTCNAGTCTCDTGYAAPACDSCSFGYYGYPNCLAVSCGPSPTGKGGDMCDVPAGPFMMGCNSAVDNECYPSYESPYHEVVVPAFKMDRFEVTVGEFLNCVSAGSCSHHFDDGNCELWTGATGWQKGILPAAFRDAAKPAVCIDWEQAKAYCGWVGKRLPTEAEWEKAARGVDGQKYPWGNSPVVNCDLVVVDDGTAGGSGCGTGGTMTVGSKRAGDSPFGIADMIGNVWEWIEDDYHGSYSGAPIDGSAWADNPRSTSRVLRGGAWRNNVTKVLRASTRSYDTHSNNNNSLGLRCSL